MLFSRLPRSSKTRMVPVAGVPEPSTRPRFVRNLEDCAICWRERIGAPEEGRPGTGMMLAAFVAKRLNGTAAMNCPNVPAAVFAYVRLEAYVSGEELLTGRISNEPKPESFGSPVAPKPKKSFTMSLSAMLWPGATVICVLPPGVTGVTRLTDTGVFASDAPPAAVTLSVPVFAPGGSAVGFAVTVTVVPPAGIVPELGETVRYGLSMLAVKAVPCAASM